MSLVQLILVDNILNAFLVLFTDIFSLSVTIPVAPNNYRLNEAFHIIQSLDFHTHFFII